MPIEHILTRKGLLKTAVEGRVPGKTSVGRPRKGMLRIIILEVPYMRKLNDI